MKNIQYLLLVFLFCFSSNINGQTVINRTLYFDVDQHNLTPSSEASLLNLVGALSEYRESIIEIVGHTDQQGSLEYNMELSKKRAQSVKQFVIDAGYPTVDVKMNFLGESDLLSNVTDRQSMQANRRVSVVAHMYKYETIKDFVSQLRPSNEDKVEIDNKTGEEVNLSQGTLAKIPADAFCNLDGSPLESNIVEITFKEAFDYTQMLDNRLFTQTADNILETGGMIHIGATQNGIPVRLNDGKEIELLFPEQKSKSGMELFTGVSNEEGTIWEETGEEITEQKEDIFIQVDFSPISNFKFEYADNIAMPMEPMPRYPKALKKPQPPAKSRYSGEKYAEMYQKYEVALILYYESESDRAERRKAWNQEVNRRKKMLYDHKKTHISRYVKNWVAFQIKKMSAQSDKISHIKLMGALNTFLERKVGDADYKYLKNRNEMFRGALHDVLEYHPITPYNYSTETIGDYCSALKPAIMKVNQQILDKKVEMGIVDVELSRYVVRTSSLGWINCDRFYKLKDSEKMNFQFARESKDFEYYLIFKDIKSMIKPIYANGKIKFSGLPIGEDVRLVSVGVSDNEFRIASQDFKLSREAKLNMNYRNAKLQDVRDVLENI